MIAGLKKGLREVPIIYWLYFGVRRGIYTLWRGSFYKKNRAIFRSVALQGSRK
jgi:hypothetical protein